MATVTYVKKARARFDKDRVQKPLNICDKCSKTIEVGTPYKHISIKTGPYSSHTLIRCGACPTWHVWEYSNSTSARIAEIQYITTHAAGCAETKDAVESALTDAAEAIRGLAEEKREAAHNIEEGFGHSTSQSEELSSMADDLEAWADEVEGAEVPDDPDPEEADCEECSGARTGGEDMDTCSVCNGSGHPDEPTEDQIQEWQSAVEDAISVLENSPI